MCTKSLKTTTIARVRQFLNKRMMTSMALNRLLSMTKGKMVTDYLLLMRSTNSSLANNKDPGLSKGDDKLRSKAMAIVVGTTLIKIGIKQLNMTKMVEEVVEVNDLSHNAALYQKSLQERDSKNWMRVAVRLQQLSRTKIETVGVSQIVGGWQIGMLEAVTSPSNEELENTISMKRGAS